jgi:hypothetical protein
MLGHTETITLVPACAKLGRGKELPVCPTLVGYGDFTSLTYGDGCFTKVIVAKFNNFCPHVWWSAAHFGNALRDGRISSRGEHATGLALNCEKCSGLRAATTQVVSVHALHNQGIREEQLRHIRSNHVVPCRKWANLRNAELIFT